MADHKHAAKTQLEALKTAMPSDQALGLSAVGQLHATLALVEATERLAKAQETANLIARLSLAMNMTAAEYEGLAEDSREETERSAEEVARRLSGYRS